MIKSTTERLTHHLITGDGLRCLVRKVSRFTLVACLSLSSLCALQLLSFGFNHSIGATYHLTLSFTDNVAHAQSFGQSDRQSDNRRSQSRRDTTRSSQTAQAQRNQAMQEVKRRFPGAHVLKLKPVGNSNTFRARVLTSNGKIKVVNVRARDF